MTTDTEIKRQVREFYDQVGWQALSDGFYQNARFEDLRPVSREYIHRCHLRVLGHLRPAGRFLLDAGSGPIQYPEYLLYSRGYDRRVCVDLSRVALEQARARIGPHGSFVVADVANLPFKASAFDGAVSLHTIHHLPEDEHLQAYRELYRVLTPGSTAVVVNGWKSSTFKRWAVPAIRFAERLLARRRRGARSSSNRPEGDPPDIRNARGGTFVNKHDPDWLKRLVGAHMPLEIRVWRSLNVRFMRAFIHPRWGGRWLLRLVYWLEERFPRLLGEHGAYPLIVIRKVER